MRAGAVFSARARVVVLLLGVVSFVATVSALLWGGELVEPEPTSRDSYGRGTVLGHRAVVEALEAMGLGVTRLRRGRYGEVRPPVLFIEPSPEAARVGETRYVLRTVLAERAAAGLSSVVVLPKWAVPSGSTTSSRVELESPGVVEEVLGAAFPESAALPSLIRVGPLTGSSSPVEASGSLGRFTVELPHRQSLVAPAGTDVLLGVDGAALVLGVQATGVIVVSDPDLLHNWNVQRGQNAAVVAALLRTHGGSEDVYVDEVFHGHGRELSLGEALGSFPAVLLTAHLLALVVVFVVAGLGRFGPAREAAEPHGRGPAEVIGTAAAVLSSGQSPSRLAVDYVEHVLYDLTVRLGVRDAGDGAGRAAAIDAVARRRGEPEEARSLLEQARALDAGGAGKKRRSGEALRLARQAHLVRTRLLREHRLSAPWRRPT